MLLRLGAALAAASLCWAQAAPPDVQRALESVTANSLRAHVAFLASDLLEGRDSPSRGLDIAAEYIASRFRASGIEPLGDEGYFQTMRWRSYAASPRLHINADGKPVPPGAVRTNFLEAHAEGAPVDEHAGTVEGRIVRMEFTSGAAFRERIEAWQKSPPAAVVVLDENDRLAQLFKPTLLVDPEKGRAANVPVFAVHDPEAVRDLRAAASIRIDAGPAEVRESAIRNVVGVLRGSHPELSKQAVVVSAHYDHEGMRETGEDRVLNGANDNASGTAVVLETARAFAQLPVRPARSAIFIAFAAEEKGLLGSSYYVRHPLWPLKDTAANINFEMFGRTAPGEYSKAGQMTLTGAGYSSVTAAVRAASEALGLRFFIYPDGNDEFFARSDNFPFAQAGIPAHTMAPGFVFDDYHQPGDEWAKLDYENFERAARAAALAVYMVANEDAAPKWDLTNVKGARYANGGGR